MNKKEAAQFDRLQEELRVARAWRRTEPVARDVPPPPGFNDLSRGWDFTPSGSVFKACSSSVSHGWGWEKTSSQQPAALFSTEERALAALRHYVEQEAAQRLAEIDKRIAATKDPA